MCETFDQYCTLQLYYSWQEATSALAVRRESLIVTGGGATDNFLDVVVVTQWKKVVTLSFNAKMDSANFWV